MDTIQLIFALLVAFQVKHFLADYPFQTKYMLGKFKETYYNWVGDGKNGVIKKFYLPWVAPLSAHCLVHASITYIIAVSFGVDIIPSIFLAGLDFCAHFIMDRIKASPKLLGRYKTDNPKFWWSLGLDQGVHHLTHYAIIFLILVEIGIV